MVHQCRTRSLSARSAHPPLSRAASPALLARGNVEVMMGRAGCKGRACLDCHACDWCGILEQPHGRLLPAAWCWNCRCHRRISDLDLVPLPFSLLKPLTKAERLPKKFEDVRPGRQPVQEGRGQMFLLECVIMPLSLIVLLVEAILGAVSYLPPLNIPSRACLWLAGIQSVCPPSANDE